MADLSKITLPSGDTYDIKDAVARAAINGIFVIAWNGTGTATANKVPKDVVAGSVTGTLAASADTLGKFYLVKSSSQQDPTLTDIYDEYVTVDNGASATTRYTWEKIGDTQIKLTEVVTNVELNKSTANVIGSGATLKVIAQPAYTVTPKTTYIGASASGGSVTASGDNVTVVTGYNSPSTDTFLKKVTANTSKLSTTTVRGVKSSTATASKATAATTQTTVSGLTASTSNADLLADCSVSGETLVIKAKKPSTQDTTQFTFSDVTVPVRDDDATTVATGSLASNGGGSAVATGVTITGSGYTADALIGLGTASTDTVIGTNSALDITTEPTITLNTNTSTATGRVAVASTAAASVSQTTNVAIGWNSKDEKTVLTNGTTITVTHPN